MKTARFRTGHPAPEGVGFAAPPLCLKKLGKESDTQPRRLKPLVEKVRIPALIALRHPIRVSAREGMPRYESELSPRAVKEPR